MPRLNAAQLALGVLSSPLPLHVLVRRGAYYEQSCSNDGLVDQATGCMRCSAIDTTSLDQGVCAPVVFGERPVLDGGHAGIEPECMRRPSETRWMTALIEAIMIRPRL